MMKRKKLRSNFIFWQSADVFDTDYGYTGYGETAEITLAVEGDPWCHIYTSCEETRSPDNDGTTYRYICVQGLFSKHSITKLFCNPPEETNVQKKKRESVFLNMFFY